jgi:predicted methyltransferase
MPVTGLPGASLYGWREFFPNSKIFGADIDKNIIFESDNIKTFYCDQTNSLDIKNMWNDENLKHYMDIIIEDGLHTFEANVTFFENSIHKLKKNGIYIIEDIDSKPYNNGVFQFKQKIPEWEIKYPELIFQLLEIPSGGKKERASDNTILIVKKIK